ncbi:MAG: arginine--tRNA ligase [Nitrospirae bacterium]|nr:arginine--tRNA ligase [Nitrospirota bacterium]
MRKALTEILRQAIDKAITSGGLKTKIPPPVILEIPRDETKGDYATTLAMTLSSVEKTPPRKIAELIVENIEDREGILERLEIAGPGYINIFLRTGCWLEALKNAVSRGEQYGKLDIGEGKLVQVEFVSANPTGPLHIGHGRGAAFGDSLANLLRAAGYNVQREYYINDVGNQMETLGRSTYIRYNQIFDPGIPFMEDGYKGDYIKDIAKSIVSEVKDKYFRLPEGEAVPFFTGYAKDNILDGIRKDLEDFGVRFDNWFSERNLYDSGEVDSILKALKERGYLYEREDALWLNTTLFGDDKDRVVVRSNGQKTYFASDIAYHQNKFERKFNFIIDIWGADHHGYEPRMKAGVHCLGYPEERLKVILVQLVTLLREGKPVSMSTRAGEFVTLREVLDEVGRDAARFMFLTRRSDSHLDFDLELAKKESAENPVYYVQYAHARIVNIFRQAEAHGILPPSTEGADLLLLSLPEEIRMIKLIAAYPELIEASALALEPHRVTFYLQDLATALHNYYFHHRVITDDLSLTEARLILLQGVKQVLKSGLMIIGVSAPERM